MKRALFVLALLLSYTAFSLLPSSSFMVQSEPDPTFSSSMIVLVDNSIPKQTYYNYYANGVGKWLEWWKINYEEVDVSTTTISRALLDQYSAILIAQFKLVDAGSVDSSELQAIYETVTEDGVGLIQVDSYLSSYQSIWPDYVSLFNVTVNNWVTTSGKLGLTLPSADHFITEIYRPGTTMSALFADESTMVFQNVTTGSEANTLAAMSHQTENYPAVIANTIGYGNTVLSTFSTGRVSLGLPGYDGYGERMNSKTTSGMNGLLWRSIVWASKKPFAFMGMPPFLAHRVDDVAGEIADPIYMEKILQYGFWGDFNLFQTDVENRGPSYQDMLKNYYLEGSAHFSPHAWTDPQFIFWDNWGDTEFSPEDLALYFAAIDSQYEAWGITPSAMFVPHYYKIGANALPFLRERGWLYTNTFYSIPYDGYVVEGNWIWESEWERPGIMDYIDEDRTVFDVCVDMPVGDAGLPYQDYLEGGGVDVEEATSRLLCALEHGLSDLFWGQVFTHEQRCWDYTADDWDSIFGSVFGNLTAQYPFVIKASSELIARYIQNRANVSIVGHNFSGNTLTIDLSGNSTLPIALYVFSDSKITGYTGMLDYFRGYGDNGYMVWIPPYEDGHQTTITFGDVETNTPRVHFTTANITSTSSSPDQMTISAKPVWIHDKPVYFFEVNCSISGRPVSIFTAQGNPIQFSYDEATKIASFNRTLPIVGSDTILTWAGARFDFGMPVSPLEASYTLVTNETVYSPSVGFGWVSTTNLTSRDRGAPDVLRRDLVFGNFTDGFFNVDLANGDYAVTVVMGDQSYLHDLMDVYAEGVLVVDDLTAPAGGFQNVTFYVSVLDGQLNLWFTDDGGLDPNWAITALTIRQGSPSPPTTSASFDFGTLSSPLEVGFTQISEFTLYHPSVGYGWTSVVGLSSRDRGAPDSLKRDLVQSVSESIFSVDLPNGNYSITLIIGDLSYTHDLIDIYAENILKIEDLTVVAPNFQEITLYTTITDGQLSLRFVDNGGCDLNWAIVALSVQPGSPPTEAYFDFGGDGSPVEPDYTKITESSVYSIYTGYGWTNPSGLSSRDRGAPDNLKRDLVQSVTEQTFNIDLANGYYQAIFTIGDLSYTHDLIDIYAEEVLKINDLNVIAGNFQEVSLYISIADGQLNLRILDDGGGDGNWVINSLIVQPGVPPTPPTSVLFDFGTPSSPTETNYVRVTESDLYSASTGYGWASTFGLKSRDRGAPDNLKRDLVQSTTEHIFNVDLVDGDYMITMIIGDQSFGHDLMDVYAEGVLVVDDLTAPAGGFQNVTFNVAVADEQLNLMFLDDGGADLNWVICSLTVHETGPLSGN